MRTTHVQYSMVTVVSNPRPAGVTIILDFNLRIETLGDETAESAEQRK